jgi:hypothetical protein
VEFACGFIRIAARRSDSGLLYLLFGILRLSGDFRPGMNFLHNMRDRQLSARIG